MNLDDLLNLGKRTLDLFGSLIKSGKEHIIGYGPGSRPLAAAEKVKFYYSKLKEYPAEDFNLDYDTLLKACQLAGYDRGEVMRRLGHWPPIKWSNPERTVFFESPWVWFKRWQDGGPQMLGEIEDALKKIVIGEAA